jgi:Xaa-Pro dipeptidase
MTQAERANLVNRSRLEHALEEANLAAIFVTSPVNVTYLSRAYLFDQHERTWSRMPQFVVWPRAGGPAVVASKSAAGQAERETWIDDIRTYAWPNGSPAALLVETLAERGLDAQRIGYEANALSAGVYGELARSLPRAELVPIDDLLERVRVVKTPGEIEILQRIARLTEQAIAAGFASARRGESERAMANRMMACLHELGADDVKLPYLAFGANAATRRRPPSEDPLRGGDTIRVDFGGWLQGFPSDISRMAVAGPPTARQRDVYNRVRDTQVGLFERMRPGAQVGDLYRYYREQITSAGLPFNDGVVIHSLGAQVHEYPVVMSQDTQGVLEEGMVMSVEPTVTLPGEAKYTVEDCVLVTPTGARRLSDCMDTSAMQVV